MDVLEEYCQVMLGDPDSLVDQTRVDSTACNNKDADHSSIDNIPTLKSTPQTDNFCFEDPYFESPYFQNATAKPNSNVARQKNQFAATKIMTKVTTTAFICNKGGTGKTTACINIAGWLAKMGRKVLVIDLDPQASATAGLGIQQKNVTASAADALMGLRTLSSLILPTASNVFLIPARADLLLAERNMIAAGKSAAILKSNIANLTEPFDHILIDAPAGHGLLTLNAIAAGNNVIVPMDTSLYAKQAAVTLLDMFKQMETMLAKKINIVAVLVRETSRLSVTQKLFGNRRHIEKLFHRRDSVQAQQFTIPHSMIGDRAAHEGLTLADYAPLDNLSLSFKKVARFLSC